MYGMRMNAWLTTIPFSISQHLSLALNVCRSFTYSFGVYHNLRWWIDFNVAYRLTASTYMCVFCSISENCWCFYVQIFVFRHTYKRMHTYFYTSINRIHVISSPRHSNFGLLSIQESSYPLLFGCTVTFISNTPTKVDLIGFFFTHSLPSCEWV